MTVSSGNAISLKLERWRRFLVRKLTALPPAVLGLSDEGGERLGPNKRFLRRAHRQLPTLRALEIAVVFSGDEVGCRSG